MRQETGLGVFLTEGRQAIEQGNVAQIQLGKINDGIHLKARQEILGGQSHHVIIKALGELRQIGLRQSDADRGLVAAEAR